MNLSYWNKLVLLFVLVIVLILINKTINLDNLFGLNKKTVDTFIANPSISPTPSQTNTPSSSVTKVPTQSNSTPTPTILKSIQRIRNNDFESDN